MTHIITGKVNRQKISANFLYGEYEKKKVNKCVKIYKGGHSGPALHHNFSKLK